MNVVGHPKRVDGLAGVSLARVPTADLAALGRYRDRDDVRVAGDDGDPLVWVRWPVDDSGVLMALLPMSGVEFFREEDGVLFRAGRLLPANVRAPGASSFVALDRAIAPARVEWEEPRRDWVPVGLRLVADDRPRATSAMRAGPSELLPWAESVPSAVLGAIEATSDGATVILIGGRLPWVEGERWWGSRVFVPLGHRPDPELPESLLVGALGLQEGERAILSSAPGGVSAAVLSRETFGPLTLGGLRRLGAGGGPSP